MTDAEELIQRLDRVEADMVGLSHRLYSIRHELADLLHLPKDKRGFTEPDPAIKQEG